MKKTLKENPIKKAARRMLREGEIDSAEAALAAKDQVDRLQDMVEEISKMANEELPKLVDKIRSSFGGDKATAYQEAAGSVFSDLLNVAKEKRSALEQSVLVLTGDAQAEQGPKTDLNLPDEEGTEAEGGDESADLDDADFMPDGGEELTKAPAPLGRETRLPAEESRSFNAALNRAKIVAIKEALDKTDSKKFPVRARRLAEELNRLAIVGIKEEAKKKSDAKTKVFGKYIPHKKTAKKADNAEKTSKGMMKPVKEEKSQQETKCVCGHLKNTHFDSGDRKCISHDCRDRCPGFTPARKGKK